MCQFSGNEIFIAVLEIITKFNILQSFFFYDCESLKMASLWSFNVPRNSGPPTQPKNQSYCELK